MTQKRRARRKTAAISPKRSFRICKDCELAKPLFQFRPRGGGRLSDVCNQCKMFRQHTRARLHDWADALYRELYAACEKKDYKLGVDITSITLRKLLELQHGCCVLTGERLYCPGPNAIGRRLTLPTWTAQNNKPLDDTPWLLRMTKIHGFIIGNVVLVKRGIVENSGCSDWLQLRAYLKYISNVFNNISAVPPVAPGTAEVFNCDNEENGNGEN